MRRDPSWFQVSEVAPGIHAIAEPGHVQSYLETLSRLAGRASALSALLPSHDRTPLEPTFLHRLRDALEALVAGDAPWAAEEGWHAPVRRWGFNGLEILAPEPGTPGVDLLRWPPGATTAP